MVRRYDSDMEPLRSLDLKQGDEAGVQSDGDVVDKQLFLQVYLENRKLRSFVASILLNGFKDNLRGPGTPNNHL